MSIAMLIQKLRDESIVLTVRGLVWIGQKFRRCQKCCLTPVPQFSDRLSTSTVCVCKEILREKVVASHRFQLSWFEKLLGYAILRAMHCIACVECGWNSRLGVYIRVCRKNFNGLPSANPGLALLYIESIYQVERCHICLSHMFSH